ncbi:MAG TPA: hypothetical protein VKS22_13195 [Candidatus Binataceae bacterium]|nr:hypothetical protein [Candidatus Binataceae bacterium]
MTTKGASKKSTHPRPRLTVDISPALKRRIKVAAAAQGVAVSAYIANVFERAVPEAKSITKGSDGKIVSRMILRAKRLRDEQHQRFSEDSADLLLEAQRQRHTEL